MKLTAKLALVLVAASSSVVGLASSAFAQTAPSQNVGAGIVNLNQSSPNAAAAATFRIDGTGATGAASAAIGASSAAATATTVVDTSFEAKANGASSNYTNTANTATAFGSSNDISVKVGGTETSDSETGKIKLENVPPTIIVVPVGLSN